MSDTYSTLQPGTSSSRIYSSQARVTISPGQTAGAVRPAAPPASAVPEQRFSFQLSSQGLPPASLIAPGAEGSVTVAGPKGGAAQVVGRLTGLRPISDPVIRPTLWLIRDLIVPQDLSPADAALLPRGPGGTGNQPGATFTLDGNPPTYTLASNMVSVVMTPGTFALGPDGAWQMKGTVDPQTNRAFHPLVTLGPAVVPDSNAVAPTGMVVRILTDLFMRPATVHPEWNLRAHFPQRLMAIAQDHAGAAQGAYLEMADFQRAAVTLEGLVRATPPLMPTRETCFLAAHARQGG